MKRTLWRVTAVYDDRRRTNLLMVQVSAKDSEKLLILRERYSDRLFTTDLWWYLGLRSAFFTSGPSSHVHHLRAAIVLFSAFLRTWRAVGRGIFPLFHLTIVLASLLVHVWMAARSVTVTGTTSRPLPTSSSTCRTGGTLSRIPRAGVLYWDDIDNGTLSIEFSMLLFCPPATSRAAPEIFMCHY